MDLTGTTHFGVKGSLVDKFTHSPFGQVTTGSQSGGLLGSGGAFGCKTQNETTTNELHLKSFFTKCNGLTATGELGQDVAQGSYSNGGLLSKSTTSSETRFNIFPGKLTFRAGPQYAHRGLFGNSIGGWFPEADIGIAVEVKPKRPSPTTVLPKSKLLGQEDLEALQHKKAKLERLIKQRELERDIHLLEAKFNEMQTECKEVTNLATSLSSLSASRSQDVTDSPVFTFGSASIPNTRHRKKSRIWNAVRRKRSRMKYSNKNSKKFNWQSHF